MPCDNTTKTSSDIEHADWTTGTSQHYNVRFDSASSQASQSSGDICRICHCESDPQNPLLTPCYCSGSLKYVHQACLQQWLTASETNACELCKFPFIMHTKIKPFNEWRSLDISGIERRRLCCSVLFHCAAALCVIWSLCVLIERAADDVKNGQIDWPFWTKLAVVAVGLTGGIVFMYIQCKAYLHLCHRWKARNRILLIQNAPEKVHPLSQPSPLAQQRVRHSSTVQAHTTNAGHRSVNVNIDVNNGSPRPPTSVTDYVPATLADVDDVSGSCVRHQRYENLPSSPHHMLQHADLDVDSVAYHNTAGVPRSHGKHHYLHHQNIGHGHHINGHQHQHSHYHTQLGQVAVAANIECSQSQNNYERDFALDDVVSQISSFRPCPQGSGSMTPFHDSIHNVLEHSEDSSRVSVNDLCVGSRQDLSADGLSSDTGREHALQLSSFSGSGDHKAPSISSGVSHAVANGLGGFVYKPHTKRYSNSSIFLENRDILNDSVAMDLDLDSTPYIKPDYRHSSILTPPESESDKLEQYMGKDLRRYSDTKLLGNLENDARNSTLECKNELESDPTTANSHMHPLLKQHSDTANASNAKDVMLDAALPISPLSSSRIQQLERPLLWHSIQTVNVGRGIDTITTPSAQRQIDKARFFFKSLPNLSSSCESLIKK